MKTKVVIALAVIAIFAAFAFYTFSSALNPYVTFAEAANASGIVQVSGQLVGEKAGYDAVGGDLVFQLVDDEGTHMPVHYEGAKPTDFERADSVVVIGSVKDNYFQAERLLVKCPSKYEDEQNLSD
ncbi:MAG: cytochrome c maturation protein CcmE [Bacillota bacterium]